MSEQLINNQVDLLGQVYHNLTRSGTAYKEYLENGKTFKYARELRIYNELIRKLLLEKGSLLSEELQADALSLLAHYDAWIQKWDELKAEINPLDDDVFIFVNSSTFPRAAAQNLEKEYARLRG